MGRTSNRPKGQRKWNKWDERWIPLRRIRKWEVVDKYRGVKKSSSYKRG